MEQKVKETKKEATAVSGARLRQKVETKKGCLPEAGQILATPFASKLPEKSMIEDEINLASPPMGSKFISYLASTYYFLFCFRWHTDSSIYNCFPEFVTRVFDGDLSTSKEEAYQKFRER